MKRAFLWLLIAVVPAALVAAQQKPAATQGSSAPSGKPPLQAKSQDEYKAYQQAAQLQDPEALEKAADDFAEKFKNSDLRYLLYNKAMFSYQAQNNAEKAIEMGRKALTFNADDPVTLAIVAAMISERTRDTDLDRDQQLNEAMQDAQKALQTVDTNMVLTAGTPPERVDLSKRMVRSMAYSAMGNTEMVKGNYLEAEKDLKQSIDLVPDQPDPYTVLRYAIALDHQKKYSEALVATNKALELSPSGSPPSTLANQERERLLKLTAAPAPGAQPPAAPAPQK